LQNVEINGGKREMSDAFPGILSVRNAQEQTGFDLTSSAVDHYAGGFNLARASSIAATSSAFFSNSSRASFRTTAKWSRPRSPMADQSM
jgi:hypothetical protein